MALFFLQMGCSRSSTSFKASTLYPALSQMISARIHVLFHRPNMLWFSPGGHRFARKARVYGASRVTEFKLLPDADRPGMWRVLHPDGHLSDMANWRGPKTPSLVSRRPRSGASEGGRRPRRPRMRVLRRCRMGLTAKEPWRAIGLPRTGTGSPW